jgi:hypothetical protein
MSQTTDADRFAINYWRNLANEDRALTKTVVANVRESERALDQDQAKESAASKRRIVRAR